MASTFVQRTCDACFRHCLCLFHKAFSPHHFEPRTVPALHRNGLAITTPCGIVPRPRYRRVRALIGAPALIDPLQDQDLLHEIVDVVGRVYNLTRNLLT